MQKYEYKTVKYDFREDFVNMSKFRDDLNALGSDGWELVNGIPITFNGHSRNIVCIFKRKKE